MHREMCIILKYFEVRPVREKLDIILCHWQRGVPIFPRVPDAEVVVCNVAEVNAPVLR